MSWKLKKNLQEKLAAEEGAIVREWGGRTPVALIYPNVYEVGMGNLAVHSLYRMMNARPDIACERFFLPGRGERIEHGRTGAEILSIENQRPLSEFSVAAFSISFENDLLNILPLLNLAKVSHLAAERGKGLPLLIAGGASPTLNPRPLSRIFDAIVLGEAECYEKDLFDLLASRMTKEEKLSEMARLPGVWVPSIRPSPEGIAPRRVADLDPWPSQTVIFSSKVEFGNMHLIEIQRGCPFACRFCATPGLYRPARMRSLDSIIQLIDQGLTHRNRFGLVGAHILSHPRFAEIAKAIHARGAAFSPSSVRAAEIDEEKALLLAKSGHRSIALGIEAGSEKLRDSIGKNLTDDRIFSSIEILARAGITNLRLYFMVGLPGETEEDIAAISSLALRVRGLIQRFAPKAARQTSLSLTLSPFVPKPGTPFANELFAGEGAIKGKIAAVRALLGRERGISVAADSPMASAVEAYLAGAGPEAVEFMERVHDGENPRRLIPC